MKHILLAALVASSTLGTAAFAHGATGPVATAQEQRIHRNPCERGPLPHVKIINHEHVGFIFFLQDARPTMPRETARSIAEQVCGDMSLVGDSAGLTERTRQLLRQYGY